jgi:hypothetical protein
MKTFLFATLAAAVLTATSAFAASTSTQQEPGRPPIAQGPGYYRGHDDYDRGPRPEYREPARRTAYGHYEAGPHEPSYGYDQRTAPQLLPQPRRPVAVAIQIQL